MRTESGNETNFVTKRAHKGPSPLKRGHGRSRFSVGGEVKLDKEKIAALTEFNSKLIDSQVDLQPEYAEIINEHFWELLA